jgi:uncharacterized membrane protein YkvA (DUF1232 family)
MGKFKTATDVRDSLGLAGGLITQIRLGWRLWRDSRVPGWVKLIPIAGLLYFLSPIDLIPDLMLPGLGEVDDLVVLLLALKMFLDFSPQAVVREHVEQLLGRSARQSSTGEPTVSAIDVPYRVLDENTE